MVLALPGFTLCYYPSSHTSFWFLLIYIPKSLHPHNQRHFSNLLSPLCAPAEPRETSPLPLAMPTRWHRGGHDGSQQSIAGCWTSSQHPAYTGGGFPCTVKHFSCHFGHSPQWSNVLAFGFNLWGYKCSHNKRVSHWASKEHFSCSSELRPPSAGRLVLAGPGYMDITARMAPPSGHLPLPQLRLTSMGKAGLTSQLPPCHPNPMDTIFSTGKQKYSAALSASSKDKNTPGPNTMQLPFSLKQRNKYYLFSKIIHQ